MMSSTLGAPLGGTTRAGQYGVDCAALRSIFPPNGAGGGGSCSPLMVVVAPGLPGAAVTCPCSCEVEAVGGRCCARACCNPWYVIKSVAITIAVTTRPTILLFEFIVVISPGGVRRRSRL